MRKEEQQTARETAKRLLLTEPWLTNKVISERSGLSGHTLAALRRALGVEVVTGELLTRKDMRTAKVLGEPTLPSHLRGRY